MAPCISWPTVEAVARRVPAEERRRVLDHLDALIAARGSPLPEQEDAYLALLGDVETSTAAKLCLGMAHHLCRRTDRHAQDAVGATVGGLKSLAVELQRTAPSLPAAHARAQALMPDLGDGEFVMLAHEVMLGRGCHAGELLHWQARLAAREATRSGLLAMLLNEATRVAQLEAARRESAEQGFHVMGTGERVTLADWQARIAQPPAPAPDAAAPARRLHIRQKPRLLVSAITSLYKGGSFIERFMDNLVGQSCFRDYAELVIVDADSPDDEGRVIQRHMRGHPNVKYLRINHRIGIYDAWNIAVQAAGGEYLTSANVDDLRREDSLEQQATVLEQLPFVDVVYQDFFYTLDPTLPFERVAQLGFKSDLPLVTPHGLLDYNPPHNAPMWRRRLHDELGLFDTSFQSAGDYDFWLRCAAAGKTFFKLNDPHVVYYQNPEGLSTRPTTRGYEESRAALKRHARRVISENLMMPYEAFRARLSPSPAGGHDASRDRRALLYRLLHRAAAAHVPSMP